MPYRVLMELAIFLSPWAVFGIYRILVRDAEMEGRKAWPITALFGIGLVLAVGLWVYFIMREDRDRNMCREPSRFDPVTRELIEGREYPCDADIETIGEPRSRNPGDNADGVADAEADVEPAPPSQ
ncbi:MAG: hypothetical protein AAGJ29_10890 [Pseudomonadota bacterium]